MIFLNHYNSAYFAVYDLEILHIVDQVIYHRCDTLVPCSLGCFSFYPPSLKLWVLSKRKRDTGNVKYDNNNRFDQLQVLISGTAMYRTIN